ncbi:MAG TPA: PQQ-binding-like beta-propeller repeat protein [Candidatus Angelobacter sp.]|nr:PQQ-binding-like beta-propeller repeat protein [Candidatus Angelobacter sp.]
MSSADGGFDLLSFTKQLQGGTVLVHVPRPPFGGAVSPLLVGDGNVYFVAGRFPGVVYAAGATPWSYPYCTGEAGASTPFGVSANAPALSADGASLFVICSGSLPEGFFRLNPFTGAKITSTTSQTNSTEPVIDSFQHIRSGWQAFGGGAFCGDFLSWDASLALVTPPASVCDSSRFTTSRAVILPDGFSTARIGFAFPPNNQLDATGANTWTITTDNSTIPNFTSVPAVDAAGNIFIGNSQGIQARSSVDGHTLWSFTTGNAITTQPVIANGGALYAGSSSGVVYAFNTQSKNAAGTVYVSSGAVVDLSTASIAARFPGTTGVLRVSPDGSRIYESSTFGMDVIDSATNKVITTVPVGSQPLWIDISADGSRIYVSQPNIPSAPGVLQGVYVVDAATNAIIASIGIPGPERVAVAPDNSRVYVGSQGRGIAIIDPATDTVTGSISILGATLTGIAFTPDSARAYVGEFAAPFIYQIDARTNTLIDTVPLTGSPGGGVGGVIASPDGTKIYAGNIRNSQFSPGHNVFVIDTATNSVAAQIPVSAPSVEMALSTDAADLLLGDSDVGNLIAISIASDSVVEALPVTDPCCHAISGIGTKPPAAPTATPETGTLVLQSNVPATYAVTGPITFVATGTNVSIDVPPGSYVVQFANFPRFFAPAPQTVTVNRNATTTVTGTYVIPVPSIAHITVLQVTRGETIPEFEIDGNSFDPDNVTLDLGPGITVDSYPVKTFSTIVAQITISETAPLGPHDVIVKNLDRQTTLSGSLEVARKPVIVIPGIMGSILRHAIPSNDIVWINRHDALLSPLCDDFLLPLALADDGTDPKEPFTFSCPLGPEESQGVLIRASDLLSGQEAGIPDYYSALTRQLSTAGFHVITFPYDWRLSYRTITERLADTIRSVAPNPWDRVDIIAHSQGGLIAETYIAQNQADNRIGRIVFLSTPHLGAAKAFAILEGWQDYEKFFGESIFPSGLNFNTMVFLGKTFPSVYQLMPQYPFIVTDDILEGNVDSTYDEEVAQGRLQSNLLGAARSVWGDLRIADSNHPVAFAIDGTDHATLWKLAKSTTSHCNMVPIVDLFGDGTVPLQSLNGFPNMSYVFYIDAEHSALPNNEVVSSSLPKLLDGVSPDSLYSDTGFSRVPHAANPLIINTCSPVKMRISDSDGAKNGLDDAGHLLRQIPSSDFYVFNTTEASILPLDGYSVDLTATNAGLFTLVFTAGSPAVATQFTDIPISFKSRATVQYSPGKSDLQMQLDVDGDGIPDFSIKSGAPVPLQTYLVVLQDILSTLPLPTDVRSVLTDRIRQAQKAFAEGHVPDVRKKLVEFNTKADEFAAKQVLSQSEVALLEGLTSRGLQLL